MDQETNPTQVSEETVGKKERIEVVVEALHSVLTGDQYPPKPWAKLSTLGIVEVDDDVFVEQPGVSLWHTQIRSIRVEMKNNEVYDLYIAKRER